MINKTYDKKKEKLFALLSLLFGLISIAVLLVLIIRPFTLEEYSEWEALFVATSVVLQQSAFWWFLLPTGLGVVGVVMGNLARKNYNEDDVWAVRFMGKKYSRSARRGKFVSVLATAIAASVAVLIFVAWGMMPTWPFF